MWETPIQYIIHLKKVSISLKDIQLFFYMRLHALQTCSSVVLPGDDGVFHINKTSGCITLLTLPIYLKREIFNIKVKVSCGSVISSVQTYILFSIKQAKPKTRNLKSATFK